MPNIVDDKSQYCIPFILDRLEVHRRKHGAEEDPPPFFLGLNGVQGAGKTVLVSHLHATLTNPPHSLPTTIFSLDDFYLPHTSLSHLSSALHPSNPLLQHRGQPSTHDLPLLLSTFSSLRAHRPTKIPKYDKSLFDGQGDRLPEDEWEEVPPSGVKVVVFEGWAVGFRALEDEELEEKWKKVVAERERDPKAYKGRLGWNRLEDVRTINEALKGYDAVTDQLDALIHIDAQDPQYVYKWRLDQEHALRASKGSGMTDEQVKKFVDGYYPSYELFTDTLRRGIFPSADPTKTTSSANADANADADMENKGRQLRLVVGEDRKVKEHMVI
ncbi:MAG: hypothetical protein Q9227_002825 [Pyrenula ochraceoflavens]